MATYEGELRVVPAQDGPSRVVAYRKGFTLLLWGRGITVEEMQAFGQGMRRDGGGPARASTLVWLTGLPAAAPTDDVRAVLAKIISHAPPSFVGLHYLVEGEGFGSAVAHAVVTGLNLLARATLPVRLHASLDHAVTALGRDLEWTPAESQAITHGLERLRLDWSKRGGTPLSG